MDPILALLLGLLVGVVLGAVIGVLVTRARRSTTAADADPRVVEAQHAAVVAELRQQEAGARAEVEARLAATQASLEALRDQLGTAQEQYRELIERGRLDAKQREEADKAESKVLQALTPVQETLRTMQQKVTDLEAQRSLQHGELAEQIKQTRESAELSRTSAEWLASALRSNPVRGAWGETQLRTLVESAGLINHVDFQLQSTISAESGIRRPDLVVNLPGGKSMAVDAKVPYNAYIEANEIPSGATGDLAARRTALLVQHAKKMKAHVDALAMKNYWTGLDASPEFTIAYIPNEPLLAAALEQDPTLMEYAFSRGVVVCSPVSFWAVLKTVAFTWQQDILTDDAKRLFDLSKELYARLATLSDHAEKLRRSIESTVSNYNQFANSLEKRVLVTARKLDRLDESKVIGTPSTVDKYPTPLHEIELAFPNEPELPSADRPASAIQADAGGEKTA